MWNNSVLHQPQSNYASPSYQMQNGFQQGIGSFISQPVINFNPNFTLLPVVQPFAIEIANLLAQDLYLKRDNNQVRQYTINILANNNWNNQAFQFLWQLCAALIGKNSIEKNVHPSSIAQSIIADITPNFLCFMWATDPHCSNIAVPVDVRNKIEAGVQEYQLIANVFNQILSQQSLGGNMITSGMISSMPSYHPPHQPTTQWHNVNMNSAPVTGIPLTRDFVNNVANAVGHRSSFQNRWGDSVGNAAVNRAATSAPTTILQQSQTFYNQPNRSHRPQTTQSNGPDLSNPEKFIKEFRERNQRNVFADDTSLANVREVTISSSGITPRFDTSRDAIKAEANEIERNLMHLHQTNQLGNSSQIREASKEELNGFTPAQSLTELNSMFFGQGDKINEHYEALQKARTINQESSVNPYLPNGEIRVEKGLAKGTYIPAALKDPSWIDEEGIDNRLHPAVRAPGRYDVSEWFSHPGEPIKPYENMLAHQYVTFDINGMPYINFVWREIMKEQDHYLDTWVETITTRGPKPTKEQIVQLTNFEEKSGEIVSKKVAKEITEEAKHDLLELDMSSDSIEEIVRIAQATSIQSESGNEIVVVDGYINTPVYSDEDESLQLEEIANESVPSKVHTLLKEINETTPDLALELDMKYTESINHVLRTKLREKLVIDSFLLDYPDLVAQYKDDQRYVVENEFKDHFRDLIRTNNKVPSGIKDAEDTKLGNKVVTFFYNKVATAYVDRTTSSLALPLNQAIKIEHCPPYVKGIVNALDRRQASYRYLATKDSLYIVERGSFNREAIILYPSKRDIKEYKT